MKSIVSYVFLTLAGIFGCTSVALSQQIPLIIAHRGIPSVYPEHTLASLDLAMRSGADFVEPDLVMTKDSVLIVRHEPMLSGTTNVSVLPKFKDKKTWKVLDGDSIYDWFACDFTLEEIKELKTRQAMKIRSHEFDDQLQIPTFDEFIQRVLTFSDSSKRMIGIYPETKHPSFHGEYDLPITEQLLNTLIKYNLDTAVSRVFIQSFEAENLAWLYKRCRLPLIFLFSYNTVSSNGEVDLVSPPKPYDHIVHEDKRTYLDLQSDEGLAYLKGFVSGIGVPKVYLRSYSYVDKNYDNAPDDVNKDGKSNLSDCRGLKPTTLVNRAHDLGLKVHVYTFRDEPDYLLSNYQGDFTKELQFFSKLGVDGIFTDNCKGAYQYFVK